VSAVTRIPTAEIEVLDLDAWRASILARAGAGHRVVTLFGRHEGDRALLTVVHLVDGTLVPSRTLVDVRSGFHTLTRDLPALHCFEREVHEQLGIPVADHPWLKPVRSPTRPISEYPYYTLDGKEVHEVAVGPIHAGVIEPGSFRFMCFGEHVLHLEIQLGYQHRGFEQLALQRPATRLAPLVETIAGDTSIAHGCAYSAAIEALTGHPIEPDVERARAIMLELERIAMHLAGLAGMAADVGFLPGSSTYGRLRTTAINTSMRLCGNRFGRGAIRPGGNGITLSSELVDVLRKSIELLRHDGAIIDDCFESARSVRHRLAGVGVVSTELATQLGLVGMVARSAGVAIDLRSLRHGLHAQAPIETCSESTGDCWGRTHLRIAEIRSSLAWIEQVLAEPADCSPTRAEPVPLPPSELAIAAVEGWRGEVVHALETSADGTLLHYKAQDPSLRNWMGLAQAVRGNEISDFPICNKSFDLSYCGNDL